MSSTDPTPTDPAVDPTTPADPNAPVEPVDPNAPADPAVDPNAPAAPTDPPVDAAGNELTEDAVLTKVANEEPLSLEELEVINRPPARAHNDEADIGFRVEPVTGYAPAAQPDLSAPAYVLERQAREQVDAATAPDETK